MTARKDKRLALTATVAVHATIFVVLSACGLFTYVHAPHKPSYTEVMVYDENSLSTSPQGGGSPAIAIPSGAPPITETYTDKAAQTDAQREQAKTVQAAGAGAASDSSSAAGSTASAGQGNGSGTGDDSGSGDGTGSGARAPRPAQKAHLLASGDFNVPAAARQGIHGQVSLSIVISAAGSVTSADIISNSSGRSDVAQAAQEYAYTLQYAPATDEAGDAVASRRQINLQF